MYGNEYRRFKLVDLVVPNIPAAQNLAVDVTVTSGKVRNGDIGFAIPTDAPMENRVVPIVAVRATSATNMRLYFSNPSAGAVDLPDTHEFTVILFPSTGNVAQTV
jgi:hypothetical protein